MVIEKIEKNYLDVLGLEEMHLLVDGMKETNIKWESWRGVACWSGLKEEYKGKETGVAVLLLESMRDKMNDFQNQITSVLGEI